MSVNTHLSVITHFCVELHILVQNYNFLCKNKILERRGNRLFCKMPAIDKVSLWRLFPSNISIVHHLVHLTKKFEFTHFASPANTLPVVHYFTGCFLSVDQKVIFSEKVSAPISKLFRDIYYVI